MTGRKVTFMQGFGNDKVFKSGVLYWGGSFVDISRKKPKRSMVKPLMLEASLAITSGTIATIAVENLPVGIICNTVVTVLTLLIREYYKTKRNGNTK